MLAVDADANANLNEVLGVKVHATVGAMRETSLDAVKSTAPRPGGMSMEQLFDYQIQEVIIEAKGFDLLVMGRPEGAGCYCYINNVLRNFLESLGRNYPYVVIDNEAGLEHLSRRTAQRIDVLMVVSDYSINGLRAAGRIRQLSQELELEIGRRFLVINRVPGELSGSFRELVEGQGLSLLGVVPLDESISEGDLAGRAVVALPDESRAVRAVNDLMQRIIPAAETR